MNAGIFGLLIAAGVVGFVVYLIYRDLRKAVQSAPVQEIPVYKEIVQTPEVVQPVAEVATIVSENATIPVLVQKAQAKRTGSHLTGSGNVNFPTLKVGENSITLTLDKPSSVRAVWTETVGTKDGHIDARLGLKTGQGSTKSGSVTTDLPAGTHTFLLKSNVRTPIGVVYYIPRVR